MSDVVESRLRRGLRYGLAGLLGGMAVLHVVQPEPFEALIPEWLPGEASAWNLAATAAEGGSAVLLARRRSARVGGWVAAATFLAVWVANIDRAVTGEGVVPGAEGFLATNAAAWLRLPLQVPLIWASLRVAREDPPTD